MYLEHFGLTDMPFSLSPNTHYFCNLPGHQAAYNVLQFALRSGECLIKITGEVGSGKTLLCRKLMNSIDNTYIIAYIPNPDLSPSGLRMAVARELGLDVTSDMSDHCVLEVITAHLIELKREGKHVLLMIDEAQALSDESLEALRLLTNIETESQKLLQIVLFGQPELDQRLNTHKFRQLKQRVTFSHKLQPIDKHEVESYVTHRLYTAGLIQANTLFTDRCYDILYKASRGIPRVINVLCHKALLVAFGRGEYTVDESAMRLAIKDSDLLEPKEVMDGSRGGVLTLSFALLICIFSLLYIYFGNNI